MNHLVLALVLFCGVALSANPPTPQISTSFYAKLSVSVAEGRDYWRGGGIQALDLDGGMARIDLSLDGNKGPRYMHVLDRYDMNLTFIVESQDKCMREKAAPIKNPWEWIPSATYMGTSSFQGVPLNDWQYTDKTDGTLMKISVLQSNPNVPVFFQSKSNTNNGSDIYLTEITFLEFSSTPESWVFYIPKSCEAKDNVGGDPNSVIYFANSQWDCANPACSSRVPVGSGQPGYACAEFVARSLAYGQYFPGLAYNAPQSTFGNWKGYDLLYTTHLAAALVNLAGYRQVAASGSSVVPAGAIFGNAGDGSWSHTCVGIANGVVDCHNNARQGVSASGEFFDGVNAVYVP